MIAYDRAESMDSIEVCETYLADYDAHKAAGYSDGLLFNAKAADFAKAQIAFELARARAAAEIAAAAEAEAGGAVIE